jgi:hypothetical protein
MSTLTPAGVHRTLKRFFPEKNDDFECDYAEERAELHAFGITTEAQLRDLLKRRAEEVMEIDRSPMDECDIKMHSDADGGEFVANRLREGFWFSYPALLRIALELEFGKSYEEYASRRDRIVEPVARPNDEERGQPHVPIAHQRRAPRHRSAHL